MKTSFANLPDPVLWQNALDAIPDAFYARNHSGVFIAANNAAAKLFGKARVEDILGSSCISHLPPPLKELLQEFLGQKTAPSLPRELTLQLDSKTYSFVESYLTDESGNRIGVATIARDITQARDSQRQIELEREQLKTLIDNIPDPIFFKDTESRYINGNAMFATCLRANSIEEVLGKSDFDFFEKDLAQSFRDDEIRLIKSGVGFTQEEINIAPDDTVRDYQTTKTPIFGPDSDRPIGLVGIAKDITELKTAREELRQHAAELSKTLDQLRQTQSQLVQSEKMASLGILTAGIAHEINNPINFVYAGVQSIAEDFEDVRTVVDEMETLANADDPKQAIEELDRLKRRVEFREAFTAIEDTIVDIRLGAKRITEIVSGLSKFSRMGREAWDATNLHEDIESTIVLLKSRCKNSIAILRDFDPALPAVVCLPSKLNQVFMNLLSNAIDAIEEKPTQKGTITISTEAKPRSVTIRITDDGAGMDKAVQNKIFDPFFTTKRVGKGTGLGLAISYTIIEEHGGSISVESAPGHGTSFTLNIPNDPKR